MPSSRLHAAAAALAAPLLLLTGCGTGGSAAEADGPTRSVDHAQGATEVPVEASDVVVLDLGVLDVMQAVGIEPVGVPKLGLPDHLAVPDDVADVGSVFEPDFEAINDLAPDLIIVAGRSAGHYAELEKIAPTIDLTVDATDYLASFRERTTTVGEIFGVEEEVAAELAAIDAKVAETQQLARSAGEALVLLTTGGEISAYGPGSRFGWLHDDLGIAPADPGIAVESHGQPVSPEFVLETDPDLLFVIDRDAAIGEDGATAEQILDNEVVHGTTAWQDGEVHYLDGTSSYVVGSGITAVNTVLDQVQEALR